MLALRYPHHFACLCFCILNVLSAGMVTARKAVIRTESGKPLSAQKSSGALNRYCNYSVYNPEDPKYHLIDIVCKNDPNSPLELGIYNADPRNTFFQPDNGAMSRAVEDAIQQMKTKFPRVIRQIRVDVDGLHPLGHTRFYGPLVAMIDISNKLAAGLGGDDYVQLTVSNAGLRVDPGFSAELVKVMPRDGVVLRNWDYNKLSNANP